MKLAAILTLLAFAAQAQPTDAPTQDIPRPAIVIHAGDVAPYSGVLLDDAAAIQAAKRLASAEATVAEDKGRVSAPVLVLAIVGAVVLGAAVGAGVAYALKR